MADEVFDLDKYRSIGVIKPATRKGNARDAKLARDMASYKEMRRQGFQPPHVGGSYELARDATMAMEIEMGTVMKTKEGKALMAEGIERSAEMGLGERR